MLIILGSFTCRRPQNHLKNVPQAADYFYAEAAELKHFYTEVRRLTLFCRRKKDTCFFKMIPLIHFIYS